MLDLQERGCHNINFVTPEHVVPQVLEAIYEAIGKGLRLPIVYNTSAFDSLHSIELLDGVGRYLHARLQVLGRCHIPTIVDDKGLPKNVRVGRFGPCTTKWVIWSLTSRGWHCAVFWCGTS